MDPLENLLAAFKSYKIEVLHIKDNHVILKRDYKIEVKSNGLYKLLDDGFVVAPFNDIDALCRFILM